MESAIPPPARRPAVVTSAALVLIAAASAVAVAWPSLPFAAPAPAQRVAVVTRQLGDGPPAVGRTAPDLEWAMPDGTLRRLSDLRGATVIVNFWATWCEPCREELPALDRVARSGQATVLAVDVDESPEKIDAFLASLRLDSVTAILDTGSATAKRWGVIGLPTSFFIGPDGVIRHVEMRGMDEQVIREGLAKAR
ncbi:MAG TPA: TlpA disulfide reductase family protein [Candidatus Limnocylindria bacterium]|nr:TlpA disulfide reductase family protein [Candidatus Limnocylindria bacterium]